LVSPPSFELILSNVDGNLWVPCIFYLYPECGYGSEPGYLYESLPRCKKTEISGGRNGPKGIFVSFFRRG
uniref:hypothetical protein n=1 Tax=Enterocloster clostridioformis TaxID=1531 RepID=UPI0026ED1C9A